jgi:hypothetical protein
VGGQEFGFSWEERPPWGVQQVGVGHHVVPTPHKGQEAFGDGCRSRGHDQIRGLF